MISRKSTVHFVLASFVVALALVAAFYLPSLGGTSAEASGGECTDRAQAITGPPVDDKEPSIKVSQRNPHRLFAMWFDSYDSVFLAQRGPGGQWVSEELSPPNGIDPWLDTAPNGTAYASYFPAYGSSKRAIVHHIVPGHPAGPGLETPYLLDHPAIAVDQQRKRRRDRLYIVGTQVAEVYPPTLPMRAILAISNDGGRSWGGPRNFPELLPSFNNYAQGAAVIASGGDTIVVAWVDMSVYDSDGDGTLGPLAEVAVRVVSIDRRTGEFGPATTLGTTWFDALTSAFGSSPIPSVSVVRKGPHKGRAFVTWYEQREDAEDSFGVNDVYLSYSDDRGRSWSDPQQVNDDWGEANVHVFPSVAARPGGSAYIAWMDTRDDHTGESALMYGSKVRVGGRVEPNRRLTTCPTYRVNSRRLGDYFNFDASWQRHPALIFPNIRSQGGDSDIFVLGRGHLGW